MASSTPTEAEEVAALDKALTALGFTDDAKLERVLHVLMPRVVDQMGSAHASTKKKVLELLSHVNKRLKAHPSMPLPLADLTALCANPEKSAMVRNFALVYVERAHERATPEDRALRVLPLLRGVARRPEQQRDVVLRLAVAALAVPEKHVATSVDDMPFLADAEDRAAFLAHALEYLMYQPNTAGVAPAPRPAPSPGEAALRGIANVAGVARPTNTTAAAERDDGANDTAAAPSPPPPGMSRSSVAKVLGPSNAAPSPRDLARKKLALLEFFHRASDATLPPPEMLMHYLIASCDADHDVSRRGEELLKRRCTWETNRPQVDLESDAIVAKLYRAFLGGAESVPEPSRALPASPAMKLRLVSLMCRSVSAANAFPSTVRTIFTCLYGQGTTTRLKASGMELAVWVLRHATDAQLEKAAPLLLDGMLKLLDGDQHKTEEANAAARSPSAASNAIASSSTGASALTSGAVALRGFCYQALGQLATRRRALVTGSADIAARVFAALVTEPEGARASVQDAARALATAYEGCGGGVAMAIEGLLLASIDADAASGAARIAGGGEASQRLAAAQWARRLFPFAHVPARYLCVVAAGDAKPEVRDEARAGLRPPEELDDEREKRSRRADPGSVALEGKKRSLPSAASTLAYLAERHPALAKPAALRAPLPLPPASMSAALEFVRRCVRADAEDAAKADASPASPAKTSVEDARAPEGYRLFLEHCLVKESPANLAHAALTATLELHENAPGAFADADVASSSVARARHFAQSVDAPTRRVAAKLVGALAPRLDPEEAAKCLEELLSLAGTDPGGDSSHSSGGAPHDAALRGRFEVQDGALAAAGAAAAAGSAGPGSAPGLTFPARAVRAALAVFVAVAGGKNPTLAGTAAEAIGRVGLAGPLPLPRREKTDDEGALTSDLVVERLLKVMKLADAGAARRAALAAGFLVAGGCDWADAKALLEGMVALSKSKAEETRVVVGEALAFAFGGVPVTPREVLFGSFTTLDERSRREAREESEHGEKEDARGPGSSSGAAPVEPMDADATFASGASAAASAAAAEGAAPIPAAAAPTRAPMDASRDDDVRDLILSAIFDERLYSSRAEERCAACTWLLALVLHTSRHARLMSMLPEIQEAFGSLLGDENEQTQETASRGVSVVYELGTEAQRKELLKSLMGTLSGESQKRRRVKLADDSRVFQEGTVKVDGDAALKSESRGDERERSGAGSSGGSLSTYKELCSVVTDIGQPDLIYKFMDLANYQAMLNSSKGAAYGFASIARRAGDALAPHLAKLLPKLYRMQHDPNPRMREAVKGIWEQVVDDPRAAVDAHFAAIMEELLAECGSRTWRARQSSAGALAELVSGRRFEEVGRYLERVWRASLRVADDIKETVREAGWTLCRTTRGLTVRLCDAHHSSPAEVEATIAATLPMLLQTGLLSPVKEIQALAMDVLMKVAKQAGSAELRPHVPEMVKCLLEALSSTEDSRLNYIEQHASAIGLSQDRLEHARLQSAKASPMGETLDVLMNHVDEETMKELVPSLASVLRSGVGLNTRAGAGRFISRLCLRRGSLVKPHAGKLFKALLGAARSDRSAAVASAMVSAVAAVARHATEARVNQLVTDVCEMYDGDDQDAAEESEKKRLLAAHLALELSRNASDQLANHAAAVLPLAFVGRHDENAACKKRWEEVWEENAAGQSATLRLYLDEICAACERRYKQSARYAVKRQGAEALAAAAKAAPEVVAPKVPAALAGLLDELPGRVWEGKEALPKAVAAIVASAPEAAAEVPGGGAERVVKAVVAECARKKPAYRKAALDALDEIVAAFKGAAGDVDAFPLAAPLLRELLGGAGDSSARAAGNPADSGGGGAGASGGNTTAEMEEAARLAESEAKASGEVAEKALACLATLCAAAADASVDDALECAAFAAEALAADKPWTRRVAGLGVARALAELTTRSAGARSAEAADARLAELATLAVAAAKDPRVSALRVKAAEALGAARRAGGKKTLEAIGDALEQMRDGDRAPDVKAAAKRALEDRRRDER